MGGTRIYICQSLLRSAVGPRPGSDPAVDRLTNMLLKDNTCHACGVCRISPPTGVTVGAGADQTEVEVHIARLHTGERLIVTRNAGGGYIKAPPDVEDAVRGDAIDDAPRAPAAPNHFDGEGGSGAPPAVQLSLFD